LSENTDMNPRGKGQYRGRRDGNRLVQWKEGKTYKGVKTVGTCDNRTKTRKEETGSYKGEGGENVKKKMATEKRKGHPKAEKPNGKQRARFRKERFWQHNAVCRGAETSHGVKGSNPATQQGSGGDHGEKLKGKENAANLCRK